MTTFLLSVVLLAGCSVDSAPTRDASGARSGAASPSSGGGAGEPAACTVDGFTPATRLVTTDSRPVLLYGRVYALAPGSSVRFTAEMERVEPVRLRVRVAGGGALPAEDRDQVLALGGATLVDGDVAPTVPIRQRLANRTQRNQSYLFYRGARQLAGRWHARRCGAPYNDGSAVERLAGTFRTVGPTGRLRLAACGRDERGALARAAADFACR